MKAAVVRCMWALYHIFDCCEILSKGKHGSRNFFSSPFWVQRAGRENAISSLHLGAFRSFLEQRTQPTLDTHHLKLSQSGLYVLNILKFLLKSRTIGVESVAEKKQFLAEGEDAERRLVGTTVLGKQGAWNSYQKKIFARFLLDSMVLRDFWIYPDILIRILPGRKIFAYWTWWSLIFLLEFKRNFL